MSNLMVLSAIPVLAGLLVGRLTGGRISELAVPRLRATWLLGLAAAGQVAQSASGLPLIAAVFVLVLGWFVINLVRSATALRIGLIIALAGLIANGTAIGLNQRMPYAPEAAEIVGLDPGVVTTKNEPMDSSVMMGWLGDTMPVTPLGAVISIGDILLALGVAAIVAALMRPGTAAGPEVQPAP